MATPTDGSRGASFFTKCQRDLIEGLLIFVLPSDIIVLIATSTIYSSVGKDYFPYMDLHSIPAATTTIAKGLNSVSDSIYIPIGAPFGNSYQTQAYVRMCHFVYLFIEYSKDMSHSASINSYDVRVHTMNTYDIRIITH